MACRVLGVAESRFYAWRSRPPSTRSLRHAWLTEQIHAVHRASFGTYGARRVQAKLRLGLGYRVEHGAVELLMRRAGLVGLPGRKRQRPVHDTAFGGDLVDRDFTRERPDQLWVTDTELLDRRSWATRQQLANAIFEWIEAWYNPRRRHSALGYRSPVEYENLPPVTTATA